MALKDKVTRAATRGLAGMLTVIMCTVGMAFLTVAAWIALVDARDPLFAAITLGAAYMALGIVISIGVKLFGPGEHSQPQAQPAPDVPQVMKAFLDGMEQGQHARSARH